MKRLLIVEDNADLAYGLRNNLELEGYEVDLCEDGGAALTRIDSRPYDLLLLDLMLPGMEGIEILRRLRSAGSRLPVLVLTARGEESDKVAALRLGADDYVTKPFGLLELIARVEALLRRSEPDGPREIVRGPIAIDVATRGVRLDGAPVELTPKEFDLLLALARREGGVASRRELLDEVWGYAEEVVSRTVDTHVAELRRKLEPDPSRPRRILTVRKAGYRLAM